MIAKDQRCNIAMMMVKKKKKRENSEQRG